MHLLWRRYTRSGGYAPSWYYALMAVAFVAIAVWAVVAGDWLIAAIAFVMIAVVAAGAVIMPRLMAAQERSMQARPPGDEEDDRWNA